MFNGFKAKRDLFLSDMLAWKSEIQASPIAMSVGINLQRSLGAHLVVYLYLGQVVDIKARIKKVKHPLSLV